jgi:hypothetical protein
VKVAEFILAASTFASRLRNERKCTLVAKRGSILPRTRYRALSKDL